MKKLFAFLLAAMFTFVIVTPKSPRRRWTRWALCTGAVAVVVAVTSLQKPAPVAAEEDSVIPAHFCRPNPGWICVNNEVDPPIITLDMCSGPALGCEHPTDDTT